MKQQPQQPQQPRAFEQRICIRLPRPLADAIDKECADAGTNVSAVVRQSLVEHLSPTTEPRR